MKNLIIIGAGGHGRVIYDVAVALKRYENVYFLDDNGVDLKRNVVGKVADFKNFVCDSDFIVAIGDNKVRKDVSNVLLDAGAHFATLIHPSATVGSNVKIGIGSVVMAGSVINCNAKIGNGVIVNTCSSIDHDAVIGDYCHVSVGSHLAGSVILGQGVFVCAGATIINNITVCDNAVLGAGTVVIKDIVESGTYVGVPSRKI